jgi:hypothetical protein
MPQPPSAYDLHQRQRWLRHDAHLWIRHDLARWLKPGTDPADVYPHLKRQREAAEDAAFAAQIAASRRVLAALRAEVDEMKAALAKRRLEEAKYSPSQPRVPVGNPRGGRWSNRNEGGASVGGSGNAEGGASEGADDAEDVGSSGSSQNSDSGGITDPRVISYESVDGLIRKYRADAQQAQDRASELGRMGIGPGPFAGESVSARGPERDFTAAEHREINRIGSETGCNTCGTLDPLTPRGNFVIDHQPPSALNSTGLAQRLYPQCLSCSLKQGGFVNSLRGRR